MKRVHPIEIISTPPQPENAETEQTGCNFFHLAAFPTHRAYINRLCPKVPFDYEFAMRRGLVHRASRTNFRHLYYYLIAALPAVLLFCGVYLYRASRITTFQKTSGTRTIQQHMFRMGSTVSRGSSAGKSSAKDFVEETISIHPVVVFSKSYCPYCYAAKSAIATAGKSVAGFTGAEIVELDLMGAQGRAIQQYLAQKTGRRTVPNVFFGGKPVGGGDDMVSYARQGVLVQMLTQAPQSLKAYNDAGTSAQSDAEAALENAKIAVFSAGCFWGVELAFQRVAGVLKTEVGYSNGNNEKTTYEEVCSGRTGHAEVVKVWYDESKVTYKQLLEVWEGRHDVTSKDKQGNDVGTQYRSAVFYTTDEQKEMALAWKQDSARRYKKEIVTEIAKLDKYCTAESYHQQYLEKKGQSAAKGATERIRCYG